MRWNRVGRTIGLLGIVMILVLGMASVALGATITQTPNFNGATIPSGVPYTINWTSSGVASGLTLVMRHTAMTLPYNDIPVATGLAQTGSYTVVPSGTVGSTYCFYLVTSDGSLYSDAAYTPWSFTLGPVPATSTPASSPWSLTFAALAALGLVAASAGMRRRMASSEV